MILKSITNFVFFFLFKSIDIFWILTVKHLLISIETILEMMDHFTIFL
jgi:hypothetical protein